MDAPTSTGLLNGAKAQDPTAWKRLVSLYAPLVYAWCRSAGLRAQDAEDVGQNVFRAVARRLCDFHHDRPGDTFRGWLRQITRRKIQDFFREQPEEKCGLPAREPGELDPRLDEPSTTNHDATKAERRLVLLRAIELVRKKFRDHTWQAFWRVVVEGASPSDVARELGKSVNSIHLAVSRVRCCIRKEFEGLLEPGDI